MTRNGLPIEEVRLKHGLRTGIAFTIWPGVVALYEEVEACKASGYRYFGDWQALTPNEKAFLIGHHRVNQAMESHRNDAQAEEMRRRSKPKGKGGR